MENIEKKVCNKCWIEKHLDELVKGYNTNSEGVKIPYYKSLCKKCHNKQRDERRKKGISETRRESQIEKGKRYYMNNEGRRDYLKNHSLGKYGITSSEYLQMLASQNHSCKICGRTREQEYEKYKRNMPVDHCHTTGKVRGILCTDCNVSLGKMQDSPELLRKAANYIESSSYSKEVKDFLEQVERVKIQDPTENIGIVHVYTK